VSTDWLLDSIEQVEQVGAVARDEISVSIASLGRVRTQRVAGVPVAAIVADLAARGAQETRLRTAGALAGFERSMMNFRVGLVRHLVDDEGLTFTEVGRRIGVSRQMTARLYRSVERRTGPEVPGQAPIP
jgi:hypothetical protein